MSIDTQLSHGEKVRRTLMSIDAQPSQGAKVRKDLMSIDLAAKQNPAAGNRPRPTVWTETHLENLAHLVNPVPNPAPNPAAPILSHLPIPINNILIARQPL